MTGFAGQPFDGHPFDAVAARYDEDGRHDAIARALVGLVAPADHESVVDVACGTGAVALAVAARRGLPAEPAAAAPILALDFAPAMVARARTRSGADAVDWRVAEAVPLPVPDGGVDVIICASSLHFLGTAALRDWHRALRPGGRVGYTMPIRSRFRPSERFAALLARDLPVPETAKDARVLAIGAGFAEVAVTVLPSVILTVARKPLADRPAAE
jgi:ubiquinone/menaquinone biosynthesis C-methylase UbiE